MLRSLELNKMRVAVLGWGSLVWKPEPMKLKDRWHFDGPMLPVEFARISRNSSTNQDRLIIVPYQGSKLIPVLWATAAHDNIDAAARNLCGRLGCEQKEVGFVNVHTKGFRSSAVPKFHEDIGWWAAKKGIEGVVWADLPANFYEKTGGILTEYNVFDFLRKQEKKGNHEAKEYFQKAPKQIKTRIRDAVQKEFGW